MSVLGEDEHGVWLWAPRGTMLTRGDEPARRAETSFVKLIRPDGWWSAVWNERSRYEVYVDIATPATWEGDRVAMIDLDLDVVRMADDGSVVVLDEDEFVAHAAAMDYPPRLIDAARTAAAAVHLALEAATEPFGEAGRSWLRRGAGTL